MNNRLSYIHEKNMQEMCTEGELDESDATLEAPLRKQLIRLAQQ